MVVVDSSALIPLARIGRLPLIREYFKKVITTRHIYRETVEEGRGKKGTSEINSAFEEWIHIEEIEERQAGEMAKMDGISPADASLVILALDNKDALLSNDRALILAARAKNVDCYWVTSLLLGCLKEGLMDGDEARNILFDLSDAGMNLKSRVFARLLRVIENKK